jgi:hypothetical protein
MIPLLLFCVVLLSKTTDVAYVVQSYYNKAEDCKAKNLTQSDIFVAKKYNDTIWYSCVATYGGFIDKILYYINESHYVEKSCSGCMTAPCTLNLGSDTIKPFSTCEPYNSVLDRNITFLLKDEYMSVPNDRLLTIFFKTEADCDSRKTPYVAGRIENLACKYRQISIDECTTSAQPSSYRYVACSTTEKPLQYPMTFVNPDPKKKDIASSCGALMISTVVLFLLCILYSI